MKYILIFFVIFTFSFSNEVNNQNQTEKFDLGHFDSINEIEKHPKKDLFISIGKDEQIILWNFKKNEINFNFEFSSGELNKIEISPNGNFVLVSNKQGQVFLINYNTFKLIDAFNYFNSKIVDFYFINNFQVLIIYQDKKTIIFDIFKKERTSELSFDTEIVAASLIKNTLAVAERTGMISLINISDFKILESFEFYNNERVTALQLIDSEHLIIAYEKRNINLVNLKSKISLINMSYDSYVSKIYSDNNFTLLGFNNGDIKVFSKSLDYFYSNLIGHKDKISSFNINNNHIISTSNDSTIMIWNLPEKKPTGEIKQNLITANEVNQTPKKIFTNR